MHQTGYRGIFNLSTSKHFYPGFCKLWFTAIENIDVWPAVDPQSQFLFTEPTLKPNTTWYGPVNLPDKQLGLGEKLQQTAAGPIYKQALECFLPGDDGYTRINIHNIPHHEYVFIGLVRAGGYFLVFGNNHDGLSLSDADFQNAGTAAGRKLSFTRDAIDPAQPLLTFSQYAIANPPGWILPGSGGSGGGNGGVDPLIISFNEEPTINIPWTDELRNTYGSFPVIQVWLNAESGPRLFTAVIETDQQAPDQTYFTVYTPGEPGTSGFIIVK